jgi:hypothetical protein
MKTVLAFCLVLVLATHGAEVTPIQKVLQMLGEMIETAKKDMQEEKVLFAKSQTWCSSTQKEVQSNIEREKELIDQLKANIEKAKADIANAQTEVATFTAEIDKNNKEIDEANQARAQEKADYDATHTDYEESIDALVRAIKVLKAQNFDRKQAAKAEFVQTHLKTRLLMKQPSIRALMQQTPEANAYEFQSGGVVEMLRKLEIKFRKEQEDLTRDEMQKKHAHNMVVEAKTNLIQDREASVADRTKFIGATKEQQGVDEQDLGLTETALATDQKYVADVSAQCELKDQEFEVRSKTRADEITALNKAVEIISGQAVKGSGEKHLPQLLQAKRVTPLEAMTQATQLLQSDADRVNSKVLSLVAMRVAENPMSRPGVNKPLAKVIQMIKDMIMKLKDERNAEAEQKAYCNTELKKNEQRRTSLTSQQEKLQASVDGLTARTAKLSEEIGTLNGEVQALQDAIAEATKQRQAEAAENTQTIADAKAGQQAVASAITVLRDFYGGAADATALTQALPSRNVKAIKQEDMPQTWDKPYTGQQGGNTGVIAMMEVIQTDFSRLESDTQSAEAEQSRLFTQFKDESETTIAEKTADIEDRTSQRTRDETKLSDDSKELNSVSSELSAADETYNKLKPVCVDTGLSYEERVAKRAEEIQSLKEALQILNSAADTA